MSLAPKDCEALADRIDSLETSLDALVAGEGVASVQTGSEQTSFSVPLGGETGLRRRIAELKREYMRGGCAVTHGRRYASTTPRALRPRAGGM